MKKVLNILLAMFATITFLNAQNTSFAGKWKAVKLEMIGSITADIKTNKIEFNKEFEKKFDGDKDAVESKNVLKLYFQTVVDDYKQIIVYCNNQGKWLQKKENNTDEYSYVFDAKKAILLLKNTTTTKESKLKIKFTPNGFIATKDMPEMSDATTTTELAITYEKFN